MQAFALRVRLPRDRTDDLVLAAHELAANAVQHGAGSGLLRAWHTAGVVRCQVDDGNFPAFAEHQGNRSDATAAATLDGCDGARVNALPCEPGHGLWVVRQVTEQLQTWSGPHGTSVRITIGRPDS